MTQYWVKFSYNMTIDDLLGQSSSSSGTVVDFQGLSTAELYYDHELVLAGHTYSGEVFSTSGILSLYDSSLGGGDLSVGWDNVFRDNLDTSFAIMWAGTPGDFVETAIPTLVWHASIADSYVVGSKPDPSSLLGDTQTEAVNGNQIVTVNGKYLQPYSVTATYASYAWAEVTVPTVATLFTTGADVVNFNNLRPDQQAAIAAGAQTTDGLGGGDTVTLPTSGDIAFTDGDGNNTITAGSGNDTITITGNGANTITIGAGTDDVTINGTGANTISAGTSSAGITIANFSGSLTGSAPSPSPGATITLRGGYGQRRHWEQFDFGGRG